MLRLWVGASCMILGVTACTTGSWDELDQHFEGALANGEFSGNVLVAEGDEVVFERGYGYAVAEFELPFGADTRFKLHSLTKPITAVAVMTAAHDGQLSLDDSVCQFLTVCQAGWEEATVRQLLNHTSGIPDFSNLLLNRWEGGVRETLEKLHDDLPARDSELLGIFSYSNSGYVLLTEILTEATGMSYGDWFVEHVFKPAGMTDATTDGAPPSGGYDGSLVVERLARGYNGSAEALQVAYSKMYVIPGAGAVNATTRDMFSFARSVFSGGLLPETLVAEMVDVEGQEVPYGLGWVVRERFGRPVYRHDGGNNGFMTSLEYFPEQDMTLIILSNRGFTPIEKIRSEAARIIFRVPGES